ncbi:MAG TPA: type II toxin-antitoxin system prevent-host-death family antitoxin [Gemmatimonadaceae bacterium]|nr:type II toxin-antitoxin system prevent-host-death family antitoxin [Gemmatimonadaceae bacterium]
MAGSKKKGSKPAAAHPPGTIPAGQFKAICLELMDAVRERHVEFVVTKRGQPVARLAPVEGEPPTPFGFMSGTVLEQHDLEAPDPEAWAGSPADPLDED